MKRKDMIIIALICTGSAAVMNIVVLLFWQYWVVNFKAVFWMKDILSFIILLLFMVGTVFVLWGIHGKIATASYREQSLSALDQLTDGYAVFSDSNVLEYASPSFLERFQLKKYDIIGNNARILPKALYRAILEYRMYPENQQGITYKQKIHCGSTLLELCIFRLKDQGNNTSKQKYIMALHQHSGESSSPLPDESALSVLSGHGEKILVVEDTPINYEIVEDILTEANLSCEHAVSGAEALKLCRKNGNGYYKIILMDIHMPVMDGYETSKKIKEMGIAAPIIALTATTMNQKIFNQHKDVLDGYILKPFKPAQLYGTLQPYLAETADADDEFHENPFAGREKAIENLGGSTALYEKHLAKFKVNYKSAADTMEEYLSSGSREEAKILAHSIKGLAGTLGLPYLAEASAALEAAINEGKEDLSAETAFFRIKLLHVVSN